MTPAMFCEHANECPSVCPCAANCYCKKHTCKRRTTPAQAAAIWNAYSSLLAIDPGQKTGWALFDRLREGWCLRGAGVVSPDARDILNFRTDVVVIENPQIYPHSPAPPATILKLARVVGRYEERFTAAKRIELVEPHQWKGNIDGDIFLRRIEAAMSSAEHAVLAAYKGGYRHNAVDAIGLGKWSLLQPWMKGVKKAA